MVSIYYVLLDGLVFILIHNGIGFDVKAGSFEQTDTGFMYSLSPWLKQLKQFLQNVFFMFTVFIVNMKSLKLHWL